MMNRRLGIIFLATALTLIVLLNGAWYYSYRDNQPYGLTENNDSPSGKTNLNNGHDHDSSKGHVKPPVPQVDPQEEELLFDHGTQDAGKQGEPEPKDSEINLTTPGTDTSTGGKGETSVAKPGPATGDVDWSRFAYVQYVTAAEHVCNSVMVFESLNRLGSKADRVLLYPQEWGEIGTAKWKAVDSTSTNILLKAQNEYHVKLKPISVITQKGQERTWEAGFTKLLAFNATDYDRTIMFDNDATVLKHLDHLFLLPPTPLALPRAYWLMDNPLPEKTIHKYILSAQLLVVTPNPVVFNAMLEAVHNKGRNDYDMEIINWVLGAEAMVLPHRALNLLSGEFRQEHKPGYTGYDRYLGLTGETWNAKKVLEEAYYVHFSDWPRPKPWYHPYEDKLPELLPKCYPKVPTISGYDSRRGRLRRAEQDMDCSDKETWLWLYSDFKDRRKNICGLDLINPPPIN